MLAQMVTAEEHEQNYKDQIAEEDDKPFAHDVNIEQHAKQDYRDIVRSP